MKTHTIKTPTAELLIVELPEGTSDFSVMNTGDRLAVCAFDENDHCLDVKGISKDYTLLGKPDEIREIDARELVESDEISDVEDYRYQITFIDYKDEENSFPTAKESLISLLESEIFWDVNPYEKPETCFMERFQTPSKSYEEFYLEWHEAEQKTFNRNRTLIFVKN